MTDPHAAPAPAPAVPPITSATFPVPGAAIRTNDPARLAAIYEFAAHQADAARDLAAWLADYLARTRDRAERTGAMSMVLRDATLWRYRHACDHQDPRGVAADADHYRRPITDDTANFDRLGPSGRKCDGAVWDPVRQVFHGGAVTPAHDVLAHYGTRARQRFDTEAPDAEVLYNEVTLPDGRTVTGNRLARGAAAARIGELLRSRLGERGVHQVETGGDPIYAVTATEEDRIRLRTGAITALTAMAERAEHGDQPAALRAWVQAAYLAYQSPATKKGSDAATRVALVAAGAAALGHAPRLRHDIDLRAYVLGQGEFTTDLLAHQRDSHATVERGRA
ncbi:hypothetical protein [Amycolatopsis minnesotensis]|uniref:Uncharacterized protein n=1 Tax=Amycolatopsis minnesotensis TaxID=337894 RepID=A0ABN2SBZ2_9PSEU